MLKLKLQYFGHLMRRANSLEKILMLGKIEGRRRIGRQRAKANVIGGRGREEEWYEMSLRASKAASLAMARHLKITVIPTGNQ